jgi:hypothetical protein
MNVLRLCVALLIAGIIVYFICIHHLRPDSHVSHGGDTTTRTESGRPRGHVTPANSKDRVSSPTVLPSADRFLRTNSRSPRSILAVYEVTKDPSLFEELLLSCADVQISLGLLSILKDEQMIQRVLESSYKSGCRDEAFLAIYAAQASARGDRDLAKGLFKELAKSGKPIDFSAILKNGARHEFLLSTGVDSRNAFIQSRMADLQGASNLFGHVVPILKDLRE